MNPDHPAPPLRSRLMASQPASPFLPSRPGWIAGLCGLVFSAGIWIIPAQENRNADSPAPGNLPAAHTVAEHYYSVSPAPAWVSPAKPDFESPHPFSGSIKPGLYFRLVDYQANAENGDEYYHYSQEFLSVAGVHDESEFEIEFDPAYQTLKIHRILLHRDGEMIDLFDPASIRVTVPEEELEDGLLDGHVSLLVYLKDIRPGDIVEYDYTLSGQNPVFEGLFFDTLPMEWETTVREVHYRVVKRSDRPMRVKNEGVEIEPVRENLETEGLEQWVWTRKDVPPKLNESQLPDWYQPFSYVELSEFDTWGQVANWGAKHYDFTALPIAPGILREVEAIRAAHSRPEDQVKAAIRFVQDSIRYLGIEDGASAFRPAQPGLCYERRFGDCKDKTVLLGQMLGELGIDSDPVCVSHSWRHTVADMAPSPLAFDHVISRIRMPDGSFVWCDATASHQGGPLEKLAFSDFGKGLVLSPDTDDLSDLPVSDPADHQVAVLETFRIKGIGKPATVEIETTYTGSEADFMRYRLESAEPDSVRQSYLDYYRANYEGIEPDGPIESTDDREANRLTVTERYRLPDPWEADPEDPGWYSITLYLEGIREVLFQVEQIERTSPLGLTHPLNRRHEIRLQLPGTDDDWSGFFDEDRYQFESAGGIFERWMTYDSDKVEATAVATYRSKVDHIAPADVREFQTFNAKSHDLTSFDIWEVNEREQARAMAGADDEEIFEEDYADDDVAIAFAIAFGAIVVGAIGFGLGALLTFLVMRSRRPSGPALAGSAGSAAGRSPGPPPLPPAAAE